MVAGNVDTICILLRDVDPTAEKLYRSDLSKGLMSVVTLKVYWVEIIYNLVNKAKFFYIISSLFHFMNVCSF